MDSSKAKLVKLYSLNFKLNLLFQLIIKEDALKIYFTQILNLNLMHALKIIIGVHGIVNVGFAQLIMQIAILVMPYNALTIFADLDHIWTKENARIVLSNLTIVNHVQKTNANNAS